MCYYMYYMCIIQNYVFKERYPHVTSTRSAKFPRLIAKKLLCYINDVNTVQLPEHLCTFSHSNSLPSAKSLPPQLFFFFCIPVVSACSSVQYITLSTLSELLQKPSSTPRSVSTLESRLLLPLLLNCDKSWHSLLL